MLISSLKSKTNILGFRLNLPEGFLIFLKYLKNGRYKLLHIRNSRKNMAVRFFISSQLRKEIRKKYKIPR